MAGLSHEREGLVTRYGLKFGSISRLFCWLQLSTHPSDNGGHSNDNLKGSKSVEPSLGVLIDGVLELELAGLICCTSYCHASSEYMDGIRERCDRLTDVAMENMLSSNLCSPFYESCRGASNVDMDVCRLAPEESVYICSFRGFWTLDRPMLHSAV